MAWAQPQGDGLNPPVLEMPVAQWQLPPDPKALIRDLTNKVELAKTAKQEVAEKWDDYQKFYNGDQWEDFTFDEAWMGDEKVSINLVKQAVSSIIPVLLDSVPTWYVLAYNPDQDDIAKQLEGYMQALWHQNRLLRELKLVYKDAMVLGTGALKVFPNQTHLRQGSPSGTDEMVYPDCAYISPYSIFPDPKADNIEDGRYLALRNVLPGDMVKRLYPTADLRQMESEDVSDRRAFFDYKLSDHDEASYQIWEVYHDFGETLTIFSGQEVLWTGDSPIPYAKFPVVLFLEDERGTDLWGMGQIEGGGKELQETVNRLFWRLFVHARLTCNPTWTYTGMGEPIADNKPGGIWRNPHPNSTLTPNVPPPIPTYVLPLLHVCLQMWENATGVQDVTRGQRPTGITAGVAIQSLQEASQTRQRQTIRDWGLQIGEAGQQLLDLVTHYSSGQVTAFNPGQEAPQRQTVDADKLRDPLNQPWPFRVVVAPQSDLPMGQAQMAQLAIQLSTNPTMMDAQGVLDALRFPGRKQILARIQQAALANVQAAQAAEVEASMTAASAKYEHEQMIEEGQGDVQAEAAPSESSTP